MKEKTINPVPGIYPPTADYVHAREVRDADRFVFVSGTMGLDPEGRPPENLEEQLELAWNNIRRILKEADMSTENIVRLTSYLADRHYAEKNQMARTRALNGRVIPTTAIVVELLDPRWLIELEVIAAA